MENQPDDPNEIRDAEAALVLRENKLRKEALLNVPENSLPLVNKDVFQEDLMTKKNKELLKIQEKQVINLQKEIDSQPENVEYLIKGKERIEKDIKERKEENIIGLN